MLLLYEFKALKLSGEKKQIGNITLPKFKKTNYLHLKDQNSIVHF